jgi:putative ABC transport system ATP-binding protein
VKKTSAARAEDDVPAGGVDVVAHAIRHGYRDPNGADLTVLTDLDLTLAAGEHVAVSGRSGAGKTTLLALLGGLEPLQRGELRIGGVDVGELAGDDLAAFRRETVGFVFQHFGLLDSLTALENVELAMSVAAVARPRRRSRARSLLDQVGMADRGDHLPAALSGGERQRVAIARAVANDPDLLLADEPSGNLDAESTALVLGLLDAITTERGCTFVVVTHDEAVARRADRRLHLERGTLVPA